MKVTAELTRIVALNQLDGFGGLAFQRLLAAFGNTEAIFKASSKELKRIPRFAAKAIEGLEKKDPLFKKAEADIRKAERAGVEIISIFDAGYPEELKQIFDPPPVLYIKGKLPDPAKPKIAVVGSRLSSLYGQRMAASIARELAAAGTVVVSGMARGIDTAAHEGALLEGETLAVLGCGLSQVYPPENAKLAAAITKKGALISEYPMDTAPIPQNFPVRNRVISGLSRAVLVVEARQKSGALITVDAALEQGREVFAVPGNADSAKSSGANALLKQGAKLVTCAADILDELGIKARARTVTEKKKVQSGLSAEEKRLFSLLDSEPVGVEELIEKSGLDARKAASTLSMLEIKKYVRQVPGKYFIKI